jgi:hypothetical protein
MSSLGLHIALKLKPIELTCGLAKDLTFFITADWPKSLS